MQALVLWEVSRKQAYIYQSNRLKENKGASMIIEKVTKELPLEEKFSYGEYLVYDGGGSSLYQFPNKDQAEGFIKQISTEILQRYPGVEVFMVIQEYKQSEDSIIDVIDQAYYKLAIKKNQRKHSGLQTAFGIERKCGGTGLPANQKIKEYGTDLYISNEIKCKLDATKHERYKFDDLLPEGIESINEFKDLSKGNKNYMAVVHIDGNQMGAKFNALREQFSYKKKNHLEVNKAYIKTLREFSNNIDSAYKEAFAYMGQVIAKKENQDMLDSLTFIGNDKFPLIPIIIGGDDITFICNGHIGIECARIFLQKLNSLNVRMYKDKKITLNACAGVAIVKTTYPFSKAYKLADDLCNNAKRKLRENEPEGENDYSLLDWHIEQGEIVGSIGEIREKGYRTKDKKTLHMRPLYINNKNRWNNYENFLSAYHSISQKNNNGEILARNKIKELRSILKIGEKDTKMFIKSNKLENYFSRFPDTIGDSCFYEDTCMYYDAIEVIDLFKELKQEGVS